MECREGLLQTTAVGKQTALGEDSHSVAQAPDRKGLYISEEHLILGMETDRDLV